MCEEGTAAGIVRAALDAGAGGATLSRLSLRAPDPRDGDRAAEEDEEVAMSSHARECCDLVVPARLRGRLEEAVAASGLFAEPANGHLEIGPVHDPLAANG